MTTTTERRARQDRIDRVDAAVKDRRIPPERRAHWLARLRADPKAAAVLDILTPMPAPPTTAPRWPD